MPIGIGNGGDGYQIGVGTHLSIITVTSAFAQFIVPAGKNTVEFFNRGTKEAFYGAAGVTVTNGFIFSTGAQKAFCNVISGWSIYFCCSSAQTTELRVIAYD